jgi:uncharacterized coiled-coil DUF342 family protein
LTNVEIISLAGAGLAVVVSLWKALDITKAVERVDAKCNDLYNKHNDYMEEKAELATKIAEIQTILKQLVKSVDTIKEK